MDNTALTGGPAILFLAVSAVLILKFFVDGNKAKRATVPDLVRMFTGNSMILVIFAGVVLWLLANGGD